MRLGGPKQRNKVKSLSLSSNKAIFLLSKEDMDPFKVSLLGSFTKSEEKDKRSFWCFRGQLWTPSMACVPNLWLGCHAASMSGSSDKDLGILWQARVTLALSQVKFSKS